jgi:hypothetical protein
MKMDTISTDLDARASQALQALLGRVSAIELTELKRQSQFRGRFTAILARISIFGHSHTLACELNSSGDPSHLREALHELQSRDAPLAADAIPVFIAPHLSPEAQALCKQNKTGFLDFDGNARLMVGDFFVGTRSLPRSAPAQPSAARHASPARSAAHPPVAPDSSPAVVRVSGPHSLNRAASSIYPKRSPKFSRKQAAVALPA